MSLTMLARVKLRLPNFRVVTSRETMDLTGDKISTAIDVGATADFSNIDAHKVVYTECLASCIIKRMFIELPEHQAMYPVAVKIIDGLEASVLLYLRGIHAVLKEVDIYDIEEESHFLKDFIRELTLEELDEYHDILQVEDYVDMFNSHLVFNDYAAPLPITTAEWSTAPWARNKITNRCVRTTQCLHYICTLLVQGALRQFRDYDTSLDLRIPNHPVWCAMDKLFNPTLPPTYKHLAYDPLTVEHMSGEDLRAPKRYIHMDELPSAPTRVTTYSAELLFLSTYIQALPILCGDIRYTKGSTRVDVFNIKMKLGLTLDTECIYQELTQIFQEFDQQKFPSFTTITLSYRYTEDLLIDFQSATGHEVYLIDLVVANLLSHSLVHYISAS